MSPERCFLFCAPDRTVIIAAPHPAHLDRRKSQAWESSLQSMSSVAGRCLQTKCLGMFLRGSCGPSPQHLRFSSASSSLVSFLAILPCTLSVPYPSPQVLKLLNIFPSESLSETLPDPFFPHHAISTPQAPSTVPIPVIAALTAFCLPHSSSSSPMSCSLGTALCVSAIDNLPFPINLFDCGSAWRLCVAGR